MDNITNLISMLFVIFLASYVSIVDMLYFIKVREQFRWIKFIYSIVGLYWISIYTFFVFNVDVYYQDSSRILTRIGIIFLLLSLSYGATVRYYSANLSRRKSNGD